MPPQSYSLQAPGAALPVQAISNAASSTQASITNSILTISGNLEEKDMEACGKWWLRAAALLGWAVVWRTVGQEGNSDR